MSPKELADTLWAAFASDKRWDGVSGAERVNDTTITVMPFEGRPITITVSESRSNRS